MPEIIYPQDDGDSIVVDLHNPYWAALLAWLWPGAGHFYQRRFAKGFLFMICVLSTYFFGLGLGHGRVVYASLKKGDIRWQFFCQLGVGIPVFPALLQSVKTAKGRDPWFVLCERYPADYGVGNDNASPLDRSRARLRFQRITEKNKVEDYDGPTLKDGFMAPPAGPVLTNNSPDVLGMWHFEYKYFYEMGTLYAVVAGLLNMLAIYDAFVGPMILTARQQEELNSKKRE